MNAQFLYIACAAAYGVVVAGATFYVHARQYSEVTVNKALEVNHVIAANDLLPDQLRWVGKYARHEIKKGSTLTDDDVSSEKLPVKAAQPRLIAEISMPAPAAGKPISAGDRVRLCVGGELATLEGVVVSNALCGETTCRVTVTSEELPKVLVKLKGDLEDLKAVPVAADCK